MNANITAAHAMEMVEAVKYLIGQQVPGGEWDIHSTPVNDMYSVNIGGLHQYTINVISMVVPATRENVASIQLHHQMGGGNPAVTMYDISARYEGDMKVMYLESLYHTVELTDRLGRRMSAIDLFEFVASMGYQWIKLDDGSHVDYNVGVGVDNMETNVPLQILTLLKVALMQQKRKQGETLSVRLYSRAAGRVSHAGGGGAGLPAQEEEALVNANTVAMTTNEGYNDEVAVEQDRAAKRAAARIQRKTDKLLLAVRTTSDQLKQLNQKSTTPRKDRFKEAARKAEEAYKSYTRTPEPLVQPVRVPRELAIIHASEPAALEPLGTLGRLEPLVQPVVHGVQDHVEGTSLAMMNTVEMVRVHDILQELRIHYVPLLAGEDMYQLNAEAVAPRATRGAKELFASVYTGEYAAMKLGTPDRPPSTSDAQFTPFTKRLVDAIFRQLVDYFGKEGPLHADGVTFVKKLTDAYKANASTSGFTAPNYEKQPGGHVVSFVCDATAPGAPKKITRLEGALADSRALGGAGELDAPGAGELDAPGAGELDELDELDLFIFKW